MLIFFFSFCILETWVEAVSIYRDGFIEPFFCIFWNKSTFITLTPKISCHLKSLNACILYSTSNYFLRKEEKKKKYYLFDGFTQSETLIFHFRYSIRLVSPLTIKSWFGMTVLSHPDTVFNQLLLKVNKWIVRLFQSFVSNSDTNTYSVGYGKY